MRTSKEEYFRKIDRLKAIDKSQRAELMWIVRVNYPIVVYPLWKLFWELNWYPKPLMYWSDLAIIFFSTPIILISISISFPALSLLEGKPILNPMLAPIVAPIFLIFCIGIGLVDLWNQLRLRRRLGISWEEL